MFCPAEHARWTGRPKVESSRQKASGERDPDFGGTQSDQAVPHPQVDKGRPKVPGKVRVQFCHFWAPSIQKYMAENGKTCFGAPGCQRARPAPQVGRRPRTTLAGVHAAGGRASARTFAALRGGSKISRHVFCMKGPRNKGAQTRRWLKVRSSTKIPDPWVPVPG